MDLTEKNSGYSHCVFSGKIKLLFFIMQYAYLRSQSDIISILLIIFLWMLFTCRVISLISVPTPENTRIFCSYWNLAGTGFNHKELHIVTFLALHVCPCFLSLSPYPASSARYFCLTLCSSLWCQLSALQQLSSVLCNSLPLITTGHLSWWLSQAIWLIWLLLLSLLWN